MQPWLSTCAFFYGWTHTLVPAVHKRLLSMSISKSVDCERRVFEKIPRKGKEFDPAESGGHNLLEEMSLLELRQRLAYTKQRHQVYLTS